MRRFMNIIESRMGETMKTGNNHHMDDIANMIRPVFQSWPHDGDIESYSVHASNDKDFPGFYALEDHNGDLVAYFQIINGNERNMPWVAENHRGQGLSAKFILYCQRHLGIKKLIMGQQVSPSAIGAIKSIARRFNCYWTDGTAEVPFDPDTVDKFTSLTGPTKWRLVMENDSNFKWNRFVQEAPNWQLDFYSCYLDDPNCD